MRKGSPPALGQPKPSLHLSSQRLRPRNLQRLRQKGGCMANILVCDDERSICEMLDIALRRDGHRVETVNSGQAAKNKIDGNLYDLIITDIKMPNIDGIEVLRHAHRVSPDSPVILITAVDDYEAAVEAVKAGRRFGLHSQESRTGGRNQAGHQPRARKTFAEQTEFCPAPRTPLPTTRSTTLSAPVLRWKS